MLRRSKRRRKRVSLVTVYGKTQALTIANAQPYIDKLYKEKARGFDKEKGKFYIELQHLR